MCQEVLLKRLDQAGIAGLFRKVSNSRRVTKSNGVFTDPPTCLFHCCNCGRRKLPGRPELEMDIEIFPSGMLSSSLIHKRKTLLEPSHHVLVRNRAIGLITLALDKVHATPVVCRDNINLGFRSSVVLKVLVHRHRGTSKQLPHNFCHNEFKQCAPQIVRSAFDLAKSRENLIQDFRMPC